MIPAIAIRYYYFSYAAVALLLALVLTPAAGNLAFRVGAVDRGTGRRRHDGVIPRFGGLAIFAAFAVPLAFSLTRGVFDAVHLQLTGILAGGLVILLLGAYDDLRSATVAGKLTAEVGAALVIYLWGIRVETLTNPFGAGTIHLGLWNLPVTVLWVVIVTNAVNLIDGLDGLAAGTGIMIAGLLFLLVGDQDPHLRLALAIFIGSMTGFLVHNFPPATIFMGDSGSLFAGFFLAAFSIVSYVKATAMATVMLPLLAFGFPLMDMTYAVLRRYYRGVPLGEADREHIHHKLLEKGLSRRRVLFVLYGFNLALLATVLLFVSRSYQMNIVLLVLIVAAMILGLRLFGYIEARTITEKNLRTWFLTRKRRYDSFLIRRFRVRMGAAVRDEQVREALASLLGEYGIGAAKVTVGIDGAARVFFAVGSVGDERDDMRLEFTLRRAGLLLGRIVLVRHGAREEHLPCAGELTEALAEEIGAYLVRRDRALRGEDAPTAIS